MELGNKKIIITTHVHLHGAAQDLEDYLLSCHIERLCFIGHPLFHEEGMGGSFCQIYQNNKLIKKRKIKNYKIPALFNYIKDAFLNMYWVARTGGKWDLYIGCDPLNAFCGIIWKKLGRTRKTVFYCIDFMPIRFKNTILNYIYHSLDKLCVRYCDETWNVSPNMKLGREKYKNLKGPAYGRQFTVPIGVWYDRVKRKNFNEISKHTLVFVGHILEKQGVQNVLRAIPEIIKEIPDFKFIIIGGGEYLENIKKLSQELGIEKHVEFLGYIYDQEKIAGIISNCSLAIAPYKKEAKGVISYTYFADPTKLKTYMVSGLPIMLTDVPYNAQEIEDRKAGMIIRESEKDIAQKITAMMKNESQLEQYRKNAMDYVRQFDWNNIFEESLKRILYGKSK